MKHISSAIFDMDGTLVDSLMLWDVLSEALAKAYPEKAGTVINEEDNKQIRVLPLDLAMNLLHEHYGIGASGEEVTKLAADVFMDFYSHRVLLKEGVGEFLAYLKTHNVRMCIASATPLPLVEAALEHCGIRDYFETVFSCGELGKGKDTPDIYYMAQEYLGTELEETWVFEDSYVAVNTASGIGMPVVGIYDSHNPYQDRIEALSRYYIKNGETLMKLVNN